VTGSPAFVTFNTFTHAQTTEPVSEQSSTSHARQILCSILQPQDPTRFPLKLPFHRRNNQPAGSPAIKMNIGNINKLQQVDTSSQRQSKLAQQLQTTPLSLPSVFLNCYKKRRAVGPSQQQSNQIRPNAYNIDSMSALTSAIATSNTQLIKTCLYSTITN